MLLCLADAWKGRYERSCLGKNFFLEQGSIYKKNAMLCMNFPYGFMDWFSDLNGFLLYLKSSLKRCITQRMFLKVAYPGREYDTHVAHVQLG